MNFFLSNVQHLTGTGEDTTGKIAKRIIGYDGPIVVTNLLRERFSSANRPSPAEIQGSMSTLEEQCFGYIVKSGATVTFLKEEPAKIDEASLIKFGLSLEDYRKSFFKTNMDVSNRLREKVMAASETASRILNTADSGEV